MSRNYLKAAASKMMCVSVTLLIIMNLIAPLSAAVPALAVLSAPALRNILYVGVPVFFFIALKGEATAEKKFGENRSVFKKLLILLGICVLVFVLVLLLQMWSKTSSSDAAVFIPDAADFVSKVFSYATFLGVISLVLFKTEKQPVAVNALCLITAIIAFAYLPVKLADDLLLINRTVYIYTGKTSLVNAESFLSGMMQPLMYAQYILTLVMLIIRNRHYSNLAGIDELMKNQGQTVPDEIPVEEDDD
ncbi:MAG: hypothetical protein GX051_03530 [Clostridiales bacterium]|nr:hypothetical protein [Clostridiales bacterium]